MIRDSSFGDERTDDGLSSDVVDVRHGVCSMDDEGSEEGDCLRTWLLLWRKYANVVFNICSVNYKKKLRHRVWWFVETT